ncbi:MAG: hypothetical protein HY303_11265 [Candidatus Wallbacteria bacterium]|nr:hypothetical protein [Candidatus Wallbacteria bacterium]
MQLDDTLENYMRKTADFHGCFMKAPGIVIGCHMVEYALELIGEPRGALNAVTETRVCLSDCIQVMTGCTLGNKHLKLADNLGRYALTLYDRDSGEGVRVYLDLSKIDATRHPELHSFHLRQRAPLVLTDMDFRKKSGTKVVKEFLEARREVLSWQRVKVAYARKDPMDPSVPCTVCGEPFLKKTREPGPCPACDGAAYYQVLTSEGP